MLIYTYHTHPLDPNFGKVDVSGAPDPAPKPTDVMTVPMQVQKYNTLLQTLKDNGVVDAAAQPVVTS